MAGKKRTKNLPDLIEILDGREAIPYPELVYELGQRVPPGVAHRKRVARQQFDHERWEQRRRVSDRHFRAPSPLRQDDLEVGRRLKAREKIHVLKEANYLTDDQTGEVRMLHITDKYREAASEYLAAHPEWYDHPNDEPPTGSDEPAGTAASHPAIAGRSAGSFF